MDDRKARSIKQELEKLVKVLKERLAVGHLRANIMVPEDDCLGIIETAGDFGEIELTIRLKQGEGVAGKCWLLRSRIIGDITETRDPAVDWNIPVEENSKVSKNLKSILSIPIYVPGTFDPYTTLGEVLAVLNIDSNEKITAKLAEIDIENIQEYIFRFQNLLAEEDEYA